MTWVKLDDQFFAHPKIVNLDKDAKLLYLAGLTYCAQHLTDGLISAGGLRIVLAMVEAKRQAVTALVTAGLWDSAPDGAYQVHDYLEYNPSAEQVKHDRHLAAQRQAEWRERKGAARVSVNGGGNAGSNGVTNGYTNGVSQPTDTPLVTGAPYRSHPVQDKPKEKDRTNPPSIAPTAPACEETRPANQAMATVPVDNFAPFAARCWAAYPARKGKKLHKADFMRRLKAVPSRDWDAVETAITHYAASSQVLRGFAEDPHRFLTHWEDWQEPEAPDTEGSSGHDRPLYQTADERRSESFAAWGRLARASQPAPDDDPGEPGPHLRLIG